MWKEAILGNGVLFYLMIGIGVVGIIAKIVNHITLQKLIYAAGNFSKSTHKLMKLIRAKYEHACMLHDKVENVDAFVEKYLYEFRGIGMRIHTWRQIQIQSIWFSGILGVLGAGVHFMEHGLCEQVYQYAAVAVAETILLFVISQLTDEQYKLEAIKNYTIDYLENVCIHKFKKVRQNEKNLDVIGTEILQNKPVSIQKEEKKMPELSKEAEAELPITIEGEPTQKSNAIKSEEEVDEPTLKQEAIRQILEEFLA